MPELIDISLPISADMPVYPGTAKTQIKTVKSGSGHAVLSEITMTSHAGTHIDAPNHFIAGAPGIDDMDLEIFCGECRVLDMTSCYLEITKQDLEQLGIQPGERILLKTNNSLRGFDTFYEDYIYLTGEAATYLAERECALVGIDSLSIKQKGSSDNTSHTALLSKGIAILEGINLAEVAAGVYKLYALPLAFKGLDGSPTRAVLIKD